ncbi:MAG TPA: polysaccharide deacetylase family protein [Bacteroidales bacterium]|nr:polysaccharide deacetylase family protein [Bacteroidales bacterium]HPJ58977.1 polysaccharide deacetylase family protein [Bacteroidales bacterium]HPR12021.1 polysaccharide deacetylase family protein [Bacteroidales bacterium]
MTRILFFILIPVLFLAGCSRNDEPEIVPVQGRVIVLMYHRITEGEAGNLYERSSADLESDIQYLINNNINIIDFQDLKKIKDSGKMPDRHCAILTFDDGDYSWYETAMPILKEYRMKATFFLWTNMIERDSFLKWSEIEYMSNIMYPGGIRPFRFGSHSFSHPYLKASRLNFANTDEYNSFLDYEMGVSKDMIRAHVPVDIDILALPFGDGAGDPEIIAAAVRNGYSMIRTSIHGSITTSGFDPFQIPALPMLDTTDPQEIGFYLYN